MNIKTLTVRWDKRINDFKIYYPKRCDGHLAHNLFFTKQFTWKGFKAPVEPSFLEELEKRGYDTKTLVFKCRLKKEQ